MDTYSDSLDKIAGVLRIINIGSHKLLLKSIINVCKGKEKQRINDKSRTIKKSTIFDELVQD